MPLAIDLNGLADLFGAAQPDLLPWAAGIAAALAVLLAVALRSHLARPPAERIVRKRFG